MSYLGVLRLRAPAWPGLWPRPRNIARARSWLSSAAGEAGLAGARIGSATVMAGSEQGAVEPGRCLVVLLGDDAVGALEVTQSPLAWSW